MTSDLIDRLYYVVGNPSAWLEGFNPSVSELIREAVQHLRSPVRDSGVTCYGHQAREELE